MKKLIGTVLVLALFITLIVPAGSQAEDVKTLRIICTSDLHGKFMPWDYALNAENRSGSMVQLASALAQYRDDNTLLVDAGDTIQDNYAEIFLASGDVHPMVQAINALNYDVAVTGNHEYNYGMDVLKKTVSDFNCKVLTGNVYDESGNPLAAGELSVPASEDGKHLNAKAITEDDLMK